MPPKKPNYNFAHRFEQLTIYHNPRCSKSRQTLALLEARGLQPLVVEYLKTPPDVLEIEELLAELGMEPRQLMRTKEPEYKALGLDDATLSNHQLIRAMHECPKLMERPIVVHKGRAAIGRPPEAVLAIV